MKIKLVKKVFVNVLLIVSLMLFILNAFSNSVDAAASGFDWLGELNNKNNAVGDENVVGKTRSVMGTIVVITRVACVGIAFIMLLVLGIKYVSSAPSDRATVMKHAVVYVVGAVVMFASSGILAVIEGFANGLK